MPFVADIVRDEGLGYLEENGTRLDLCSQEPTTVTEARSTYSLANNTVSLGGLAAGPVSGRQITIPSFDAGLVTAAGDGATWALNNFSELLATDAMQSVKSVALGDQFAFSETSIVLGGAETPSAPISIEAPWGYSTADDMSSTGIIGGRGYDPVYVTNRNTSGAGSYDEAIDSGNRNILFEVGGQFIDSSGTKTLDSSNVTVWGETAPGGNVNFHGKGGKHAVRGNIENVIVRHIRIRLTDDPEPSADDCFYVYDFSATGRPQKISAQHCSFAFASDETFGATSDVTNRQIGGDAIVSFYKCFSAYPIRDAGRANDPHNKNGILAYRSLMSVVECIMAHGEGRPISRNPGHHAFINNLCYMWDGRLFQLQETNLPTPVSAYTRFEGNRMIGGSAGVQAYDATGKGANYATSGPLAPVNLAELSTGTRIFHNDSNQVEDLSSGTGTWAGGSISSFEEASDALFVKPDGYDDRLLLASQLDDAWMETVGASPTNKDQVDIDAINSIKNNTGLYIDSPSDIPSGGWDTTVPNTDHVAANTLGGLTLQQYLESQSWWSDRHGVMPGYTHKTKLEYNLGGFVNGVPTR